MEEGGSGGGVGKIEQVIKDQRGGGCEVKAAPNLMKEAGLIKR